MMYILGMILALGLGIYIGLGAPGAPWGRQDRIVRSGHARRTRRQFTPLDWLRPPPARR
jgi:hypothetical protein